ncbi:MAG: hypothetical protein AAGJ32_02390 [Pseudomonadota bacterium]
MTAKLFAADPGGAAPALVRHINGGNLWNLPESSSAPADPQEQLMALHKAGVVSIQHPFPQMLPPSPLTLTGMGRVDAPDDADRIAKEHKEQGLVCTTLHVGSGLETDDQIDQLVSAVIEASAKRDYPLFIETHRATTTQDIRRTLDMVERFPDVRFNADLSHWYTGHEMTYGDIAAKFNAMQPVFDRVRYMHGRIGTPCCAQVALTGASDDREFVGHFREMWRRCMQGFSSTAEPDEVLPFAPELLPYELDVGGTTHKLYYMRRFSGSGAEESDRWEQAFVLFEIAEQCWRELSSS